MAGLKCNTFFMDNHLTCTQMLPSLNPGRGPTILIEGSHGVLPYLSKFIICNSFHHTSLTAKYLWHLLQDHEIA